MVFLVVAIIERTVLRFESRCQWLLAEIHCRLGSFVGAADAGDEAPQSARAFCYISLMLLFLLVFLSPDKIPQILGPAQLDFEILGKVQCVLKAVKKSMPI